MNKKQTARLLAILALVGLVIAWFAGKSRTEGGILPYLQQLYPQAGRIEKLPTGNYAAYSADGHGILGYISIGTASGYGGPLNLAVSTNQNGEITGMVIIDHRETPSFMMRVASNRFFESLVGKAYTAPFSLGDDVDAISGATYTSRAIAHAVQQGSIQIATNELQLPAPSSTKTEITFGWREIVLITLFAIAYIGHQHKFRYKKQARWAGMILGMVAIGFIYNSPITLTSINKLLMGYWPDWRTNIYWYLLIFGVLYFFVFENKNLYCSWFCPFGAAQECMGALGNARAKTAGKYQAIITWGVRAMAWLAIASALYFRNPSIASYELFGALFNLTGTDAQFILLGLVLTLAIFVKRPWCNNLCPIQPLFGFVQLIRNWVMEIWKKIVAKKA
ncbi:FMN-binding protein [bacterium]|nr:FMN-binding protein [bacterium]